MPKFHDPAPYDINEHTGYKQIFDGNSFNGWDADPTIWRVENGVMVGETLEGKPKGNNYIVYRGDKTARLRFEAPDEDRKRRRRWDSVPQRHRRTVDAATAQRSAALRPQVHDDRPAGGLLVPGERAGGGVTPASGTPKTRCRAFSRIAAR